jgi:hypothetical protein
MLSAAPESEGLCRDVHLVLPYTSIKRHILGALTIMADFVFGQRTPWPAGMQAAVEVSNQEALWNLVISHVCPIKLICVYTRLLERANRRKTSASCEVGLDSTLAAGVQWKTNLCE